MDKKTITLIGGTGAAVVGKAFKNQEEWLVNLLVSLVDDGGSTGKLRNDFNIPPVGDIRKALASLSKLPESFINAFEHRFEHGDLKGHTMGNIFLAALLLKYKDVNKSIEEAERLLDIGGHVLTTTLEATELNTDFENGKTIQGEHNLDENTDTSVGCPLKYYLTEEKPANPKAVAAIMDSDLIIIGPGDLGANTIAPLLSEGIKTALKDTEAKLVYVGNLMTKKGETHSMCVEDCVRLVENMIGRKFDCVILHRGAVPDAMLDHYALHGECPMKCNTDELKKEGRTVIEGDFIDAKKYQVSKADPLRRSVLRHDGSKILAAVAKYASQ